LTHNYTGYPLLRQARAMIARGDLGRIRLVQAEYAQDWLTDPIEQDGHKQAAWRTDPSQSGAGAIGDIGTHAFNIACFVSGLTPEALSAELHSFGPGRRVDDNAHILLRYDGGARGMIWASQIAVGCENSLRLRIFGDKGGLEWGHEDPNQMSFTRFGEPKQILTRGGASIGPDWTRVPPGHPEGYLEGFATLYTDIAEVIENRTDNPMLPGLQAGLDGMWFISAAQASSADGGSWVTR
ncbi:MULTISPECIES: Gfo/Idh/MocA family protein, partial [unclassified Phaeobacter]